MKPDQVDVITATVFRRLEQILHTGEAGFAREIAGDIRQPNPA